MQSIVKSQPAWPGLAAPEAMPAAASSAKSLRLKWDGLRDAPMKAMRFWARNESIARRDWMGIVSSLRMTAQSREERDGIVEIAVDNGYDEQRQ